PDDANYQKVEKTVSITVNQATPTITWSNPADITYGTKLSKDQLSASADVAGTFLYSPDFDAVLPAGSQTLHVDFTPTDGNYKVASKDVTINVNQATPVIDWSNPADITYGDKLGNAQLNAQVEGNLKGSFAYDPTEGTVLGAGKDQALKVTFTPDDANYLKVEKTVSITVNQATPTITWSNPADIQYGTPIDAVQLDAKADVGGTFKYTPDVGTVLNAGSQTLHVDFTSTDANYKDASAEVKINILQGTPIIDWSNPADIGYGTALGDTQLNAQVEDGLKGSLVYDPASGTALSAGDGQTLKVTFTPDGSNYQSTTKTVSINVNQATPAITWSTPASISYGTALSGTQLNADANVDGSFVYTPAAGTILPAGKDQDLHADFAPTDAVNYTAASSDVKITVTQATPAITWSDPAAISYGTALGDSQLDATADVPGTFAYTPVKGTVLNAGSQTLTVDFTPTDNTNYETASRSVSITVNQAATTTVIVSSLNPSTAGQSVTFTATVSPPTSGMPVPSSTITFMDGTNALGTVQLQSGQATLTVSSLSAGSHQITAQFSGDNDYAVSSGIVAQTVNKPQTQTTTSVVSSLNPSASGQSVTFTAKVTPATPATGTSAGVSGTVQFKVDDTPLGTPVTLSGGSATSTAVTTLSVGTHTVAAVYSGDAGDAGSTGTLVQTVTQAQAPTTTTLKSSLNPSVFGQSVTFTATVSPATATGTVTFRSKGNAIGSATLSGGVAKFTTSSLPAGTNPVQAVYEGSAGYAGSTSAAVVQTVNKASTLIAIVSSVNPSAYNQAVTFKAAILALPLAAGAPTGTMQFFDGKTSLGTVPVSALTLTPGATSAIPVAVGTLSVSNLAVGAHTITAFYSGDSTFNNNTSPAITQTVNKAPTTITVSSSLNPSTSGKSVTFTAKVAQSGATGKVTFKDGSTVLGTGSLSNGAATFTTSSLSVASHSITAVYGGDGNFATSTSPVLTQTVKAK
ncbi:MAG TPA: Ig-like domain-containing protein, partial [Methanomicrobiales archaeon]|nr:Ig-like domain-containing protein [Methanomicrobiales archaeon]